MIWLILLKLTGRKTFYASYLNSETWRKRRKRIRERDENKCRKCGSREKLEVHHRSYLLTGIEPGYHLRTLCNRCHGRVHRKGRIMSALWKIHDVLLADLGVFCIALLISFLFFAIIG